MTRTDLIKRAIESAECRLYKVRARESYSIEHQQKAENQTEIMDITIEALEKQIPKKVEVWAGQMVLNIALVVIKTILDCAFQYVLNVDKSWIGVKKNEQFWIYQ